MLLPFSKKKVYAEQERIKGEAAVCFSFRFRRGGRPGVKAQQLTTNPISCFKQLPIHHAPLPASLSLWLFAALNVGKLQSYPQSPKTSNAPPPSTPPPNRQPQFTLLLSHNCTSLPPLSAVLSPSHCLIGDWDSPVWPFTGASHQHLVALFAGFIESTRRKCFSHLFCHNAVFQHVPPATPALRPPPPPTTFPPIASLCVPRCVCVEMPVGILFSTCSPSLSASLPLCLSLPHTHSDTHHAVHKLFQRSKLSVRHRLLMAEGCLHSSLPRLHFFSLLHTL